MVHWKYRVRLEAGLEINIFAVSRISALIRQMKTVDVFLLPNLSLAVLKAGTLAPVEDGLQATYLGRFNEAIIDSNEISQVIGDAINEVCPEVKFDSAEIDEQEPADPNRVTMKSLIEHGGILASIEYHANETGISFDTIKQRLLREGFTSAKHLLRPLRHIRSHWGMRRYGGNSRRSHIVERVQKTCYDYSDVGEAA